MRKSNFIWHMIGSVVYSLASIVLLMTATRFVGETESAAFYMAFTTGQMLLTIGYFELRPFQVTDVAMKYAPKEYFGFRAVTCLVMLIAALGVSTFYFCTGKCDLAGAALIFAMAVLKLCDGLADVFEGEFQRHDRIDIAGKSLAFRTLAIMAVFALTAYITSDIYISSFAAVLVAAFGVLSVCEVWNRGFEKLRFSFDKKKLGNLFKNTILLFMGSMMCMWIWNGTKYVVEWNLTAKETLIYGIVFMPTMIINLGSGFFFKPMLTTLAKHYEERRQKDFFSLLGRMCCLAILVTILTFAGGALLGIPMLSWFYGVDLTGYKAHMLILIVAGGFNAVSIILYYAMTTMRKQVLIFVGYIAAFVSSILLPLIMVKKMGLMGASLSYLAVMVILTGVYLVMVIVCGSKIDNRPEE